MKFTFQSYKRKAIHLWNWLLSKDILIFLLFIGLVSAFWWGRSMTSSRDGNIRVELNYSGVDNRVVFSTPLPSYITVNVRDNGRQLRLLSKQDLNLTINLSTLLIEPKGTLHITAETLRPRLQDILPGSTIIQHFSPEQITNTYDIQSLKHVPIILQSRIEYAPQHQLKSLPKLSMDSVCIYGQEKTLENIQGIYTDTLTITNLRDSVTQDVALQIPTDIRCTTNQIQVLLQAEQFTDKSFKIPISTHNVPQGEHIRLFPQETTVVVRVGISHYPQVTVEDIMAVCQYPMSHLSQLPIEITTNNPYISNIRCYPSSVEYIIER